jgi:hypothetical protein
MVKKLQASGFDTGYDLLMNLLENVYDNVKLTGITKIDDRYAFSFRVEKHGSEQLVLASISESGEIILQYQEAIL